MLLEINFLVVIIIYCLLYNVGLTHQNLSYLNKTHNEKNRINEIHLYSTKNKHKQNIKQSLKYKKLTNKFKLMLDIKGYSLVKCF